MLFALGLMFTTYHFRPIVWPGAPVAGAGQKRKPEVSFRLDNWLANFAGLAAVLLALCPTDTNPAGCKVGGSPVWHSIFGATMFGLLVVFAGCRFRKSAGHHPTPEKRKRNGVYLVCAVVMVVGLALFGLGGRLGLPSEVGLIGEVTALWAFAVSWLLKSEYLPFLRDRSEGENPVNPPAEDGKVQTTQRAWRSTVRDGPVKSVGMWLAGTVDRAWGWDRLRVFPAMLTLLGIRMRLRRENLFDTTGVTVGWGPEKPVPSRRLTRSIDGTETDPHHPDMGAAGSRFGRNVPPDQLDSTDLARVMTPNPRTVSNQLLARRTFVPANGLNMLSAAWIQFEVHDWMHHRLEPDQAWEVPLDRADRWKARNEHGAMAILRTEADPAYAGDEGTPNYRSMSTHWWDASQIYGSDPNVSAKLRSGDGGRLQLTNDGRMPFDPSNPDDPLVKEVGGGAALVGREQRMVVGPGHVAHPVHARAQRHLRSPGALISDVDRPAALRHRATRQRRAHGEDPHRRVDAGAVGEPGARAGDEGQLVGVRRTGGGTLARPTREERGVERHPGHRPLLPRRALRDHRGVRRRLPHAPVDPRHLRDPLGR